MKPQITDHDETTKTKRQSSARTQVKFSAKKAASGEDVNEESNLTVLDTVLVFLFCSIHSK